MSDPARAATPPELSAAKAVIIGHAVVTLPVLGVIAVGGVVGAAFDRVAVGVLVGSVAAWALWSWLVPRWRDWVSGTTAPVAEVQRLAQATGLVWRQGSFFQSTEMRRKGGQRGP